MSQTQTPRDTLGRFEPSPTAAQRRQRVLEMRKAGLSFAVIAQQEKVSKKKIVSDFNRAAEEAACGRLMTTRTERALELQRLEIALVALVAKVRKGDLAAIDRWLRLCESRRRLLGLNMKAARSLRSAKARQEAIKTYIGLDLEKV